MKPLFSEEGIRTLSKLARNQALLAFDFDGTLAPIVPKPDDAQMNEGVTARIQHLCEKYQVAVISGRGVHDLQKRLHCHPAFVIGNHGMEGLSSRSSALEHAKHTCEKWIKPIEKLASSIPGLIVENKVYSLSIHYRESEDAGASRLKILETISALEPAPRIIPGKFVFNLLPPGAPHKGVALMELMALSSSELALYIGDDDTDEDVFSLPDDRIVTVRVGKSGDSSAQFYVESQEEIEKILQHFNETGKLDS